MTKGWLSTLSPFDATWIACEWALSDLTWHREAIARELALTDLPLVGAVSVLEHLIADSDPGVHAAAVHAAEIRFGCSLVDCHSL